MIKCIHPYYLRFAKELLRTPIKDIPKLYAIRSASVQQPFQHSETLYTRLPGTQIPRIKKKGIHLVEFFYEGDIFNIYIEYCGVLYRILGSKNDGVATVAKFKHICRGFSGFLEYRTQEQYTNDYLKDHLNKTILDLEL